MATQDRRKKLTIDEINEYWRRLKQGVERPSVHKICNAIKVLDIALSETGCPTNRRLSSKLWSKVRDDLFNMLVTSFQGYFLVYSDIAGPPCDSGDPWPAHGAIEFYPQRSNRRDDTCNASLSKVHPSIALRLRWSFADGRQQISPVDFVNYDQTAAPDSDEAGENQPELVEQLYLTRASEASKLKKIAHRKWWQLHYQSRACSDRQQKSELRKQMEELELVWGRSH